MKFGKYLKSQIRAPFLANQYVDYDRLKDMISALAKVEAKDVNLGPGESGFGERVTSLSTTPEMPEVAKFEGKDVTEADFFTLLEAEMAKVDEGTHERVKATLARVEELEAKVSKMSQDPSKAVELRAEAQAIGDEFLSLEKFANINYLAIHKILKKHDKCLPIPCRRFYIMRLAGQRWVKHDYSKIFVSFFSFSSNKKE